MRRISVLVLTLFAGICVVSGFRSTQAVGPGAKKVSAAMAGQTTVSSSSPDACFDPKSVSTENQRAWCLWWFVTRDVKENNGQRQPFWSTWEEKPEGGLSKYTCQPHPAKKSLDEGSTLEHTFALTEGTAQLERKTGSSGGLGQTYFNQGAMEEICSLAPPVAATLGQQMDRIAAATPLAAGQKPPTVANRAGHYPVIVKTFWIVVDTSAGKAGPFPVWDSKHTELLAQDFGLKWPELTIDLKDKNPCKFTAPASYPRTSTIVFPGSCFHFVSLTNDQAQHIPGTVRHFGSGADTTYILLAVNIAAKGPRGWTWQTFNWDAQQASVSMQQPNPYPLSRPDWARYVMTTQDTLHQTIYSPYLEMKVNNPSTSDCGSCHVHAVYYTGQASSAGQETVADCMYRAFKGGDTLDQNSTETGCRVQHKWFTDSIWSLANSNAPSAIN